MPPQMAESLVLLMKIKTTYQKTSIGPRLLVVRHIRILISRPTIFHQKINTFVQESCNKLVYICTSVYLMTPTYLVHLQGELFLPDYESIGTYLFQTHIFTSTSVVLQLYK